MLSMTTTIRNFIIEEFPDADRDEITAETQLVEEEIIDSLGIFLLVNFLQEKFRVEIAPEDVTLENFASVQAMVDLVAGKRSPSSENA